MIADFRLGAGRIDGFRQLIAFFQARRQLDPAYSAVLLIAGPAAAGDVAADDALNRKHGQLFAHHAVAVKAVLTEKLGHIGDVRADHVVGEDILCVIEPEPGHLGQDSAEALAAAGRTCQNMDLSSLHQQADAARIRDAHTYAGILHGTGTGALRHIIREYLATIPNVTNYKDEHVQFGGSGITVVDIG